MVEYSIDQKELSTERNVMCMLRNVLHLLNSFYIYYLLLQCKEKIERQVLKGTEFGGTDNLIKLITLLLN